MAEGGGNGVRMTGDVGMSVFGGGVEVVGGGVGLLSKGEWE